MTREDGVNDDAVADLKVADLAAPWTIPPNSWPRIAG